MQFALAVATGKSCLQCFVNFAVLFTQNWVSAFFARNATPNPFVRASGEGVTSLNPSSPWPPPCITERGSTNGDCDHVGLLSNIISKNIYWWHFAHCRSSFPRRYIDFECKNFVSQFGQEKVWSACISLIYHVSLSHWHWRNATRPKFTGKRHFA